MASWKPKHCSCCVLLINYILCNKFVLDDRFTPYILLTTYLCSFVTDVKGSEFRDFSLFNSNSRCHCGSDLVQKITCQNSLHKLLSNTVNVTSKEQLYCQPIKAKILIGTILLRCNSVTVYHSQWQNMY